MSCSGLHSLIEMCASGIIVALTLPSPMVFNCAHESRRGRLWSEAPVNFRPGRTGALNRHAHGAAAARAQRQPGSVGSPLDHPRHLHPRCRPRHLPPRGPRIPCPCPASTPSHPSIHPSCRPTRPWQLRSPTLIQAPIIIVCNLDGPHCGSYGVCSMK